MVFREVRDVFRRAMTRLSCQRREGGLWIDVGMREQFCLDGLLYCEVSEDRMAQQPGQEEHWSEKQ